ncbi:MAG: hypothetical protein AB8G15_18770 [Saprospiraceae bacterium]
MWFEKLFGFSEESIAQVQQHLIVADGKITSTVNGKSYQHGRLEVITLETLKRAGKTKEKYQSQIQVVEVIGNVQHLHQVQANEGAFFQAASQFNLLEMISPQATPALGVGIYENDRTQGPACAIACGAGTVYRNYFVPIKDQIGQSKELQIDCLATIAEALDNDTLQLWEMQNGYALPTSAESLRRIATAINTLDTAGYEALKGKLEIGIQWDTEVTMGTSQHTVTQAYCSALPVAYAKFEAELWEPFARLILEATYEATLYAALQNFEHTKNPKVYLTLVGGGAFGNARSWIFEALAGAINQFKNTPLEIKIVSYGKSDPAVEIFVEQWG